MADKKIPLLTEVYQPKSNLSPGAEPESRSRPNDANFITPELIARIASHIKPRLEADIISTVTDSVREALEKDLVKVIHNEMLTAQAAIEARTVDFVDKTKADLKTELPRMYQASADTVLISLNDNISALQANAISTFDNQLSGALQTAVLSANTQIGLQVEAMQAEASAHVMQALNQQLSAFQAQSLGNHQALLDQEMRQVSQSVNQQAKVELQEQLRHMQTEALAQMGATFKEAMPSIYTTSIGEQQEIITAQIGDRLNQEMQDFQAKSINDHQVQLGEALTVNFQTISQNAKQDLQQQMGVMQADILAQINATFKEAIPSIYAASVDEVKAKFADEMTAQSMQVRDKFLSTINADLPAVHEVLRDNIQQMLATSLPNLELDLRNQLTAELQELLLKVKFVLPK